MKPNICEKCIVQSNCSQICIDLAFERMSLDHQIRKLKQRIYSVNGNKRKHIKQVNFKHFNQLIHKFNRSTVQINGISKRRELKIGIKCYITTIKHPSKVCIDDDDVMNWYFKHNWPFTFTGEGIIRRYK